MRDTLFYLLNERLEDLEILLLVFLCTYKHGSLFLYIWFITSTPLWSMTLLWCGKNKIKKSRNLCTVWFIITLSGPWWTRKFNNIRVGIFLLYNQKKMYVKMQHQMEVLNSIYMTSNMTALTKMIILNIHFVLSNETWRC